MKSRQGWKIWGAMGLVALLVACAPKRRDTEFSKNKAAEAGQTYSEDQLRTALGSAKYDQLVAGIGADNLNLLNYGIGVSNMTQMINGISTPGKLVALMSNGPNSTRLTAIEVLDLLNKLDDACQRPGSSGTDTIGKMVNMINNVSVPGMEGVKNIVHGMIDQPADLNGAMYQNGVSRVGFLISLLNENLSVMPTLINNLAAPNCSLPAYTTSATCTAASGVWNATGTYSASGNAKLIRLVNLSLDMRDLGTIINNTTSISNITAVMAGLNGNYYCSKAWYSTKGTCQGAGGTWTNTNCTNDLYTDRNSCTSGGGTWTPDGIENMLRVINEVNRSCSNGAYTNGTTCIAGGATWTTRASQLATIINGLTVVRNVYVIMNLLTNDGKKPGDAGNTTDGTDSMIATINNTTDINKLVYVINGLNALTPDVSNDDNFESAAASCGSNMRTELAKFNYGVNKMVSGANTGLNSWFVNSATGATGSCAAQSDPSLGNNEIAVMEYTANITTAGPASFKYKVSSQGPSSIKKIVITAGGINYTSAPTVVINPALGGATAIATVASGAVGTVTLNTAGSGYTSNPTVTLTPTSGGTGATVVAQRVPVGVSGVTVTSGGSYFAVPSVSFTGGGEIQDGAAVASLPTASVNGVTIVNAGNNYTSVPTCTVSGGGGTGATCTVQIGASYGKIVSGTAGGGSGYVQNPTVTLTPALNGAAASVQIKKYVSGISFNSAGSCQCWPDNGYSISGGGGGGGASFNFIECDNVCSSWCVWPVDHDDRICNVSLVSGGSGYTSAPTISQADGAGTSINWATQMTYDGTMTFSVNNGGTTGSYSTAPGCTLVPTTGGSGGTCSVTIGSGPITGITYTGGSGYTSVPTITISGGGGSGAYATASVPLRSVPVPNGVTVTTAGLYTSAPAVVFSSGAGETAATATATVPPSAVQALTITNGGSGYLTAPTCAISGSPGSGATCTAAVDPMSVNTITLTNAGSGYTTAPTITFSGGGGSGATAVAYVSGDYMKFYVDDVLKLVVYGNPGTWSTFNIANLPVGIHRLRWEYVKDDSGSSGSNQAFLDDITLPGDRGISLLGAEKVAVLLNKLYINSINNVADILNNSGFVPGLDNLIAIINKAEFPSGSISSPSYPTPSLVAIVNNLTQVSTLTDMLNTLNTAIGVKNMVEIVDHVGQGDKLASLVAGLSGGSPGIKMTNIINSLDSQGTSALIRSLDQLSASFPLVAGDELNEMITLINGITNTTHIPTIINQLSLAGSQSETLNFNSAPTGGQKLGLVLKETRAKSIATGESATCNSNISSFCTKNHLVRLMNDIANSPSGPTSVGKIVNALDPQALTQPGTTRMVEVLYALKNMNATLYNNALSNAGVGQPTSDVFGRLTTLIGDMGTTGALNVARLVNEVNYSDLTASVAYLVKNTNRIRYLSRLITEMTNVDLVISLINNSSTNITKVQQLLNRQGDLAYGTAATGTNPSSFYTNALQTTTADGLGRLIVLINEVSGSGVNNIVTTINSTYDISFLSSPTANFNYGSKTDGNGYGMLNAIGRIRYLSDLMNKVQNISLMINIINGQAGNMTNGIDYAKMLTLLNNVGASERKGRACVNGSGTIISGEDSATCVARGGTWNAAKSKPVGDTSIVAEVINELGWNGTVQRSISDQMRIVTVVNNAIYCGVQPGFDRDANPGSPVSEYYTCDSNMSANYQKSSSSYKYDPRHRVSNFMLGLSNARPAGIIVGNVADTNKTVNILNGIRRINLLVKAVDWMPGEVTADLVNSTGSSRISTGFVYLANNLDPDEDIAANAFTSMIHWGTGIPGGTGRNGGCEYFTAIGPKRLGGVLNTETGQYLEGIIQMFGWRTAIPALVCGLGAHQAGWGQDVSPSTYTGATASDGSSCTSGTSCQRISGAVGTVYFKRTESVNIVNNPTPGARNGTNYTHVYQAHDQTECENYYPENSGAMGFNRNTDQIVSRGFSPVWGISVEAGIGGVWDTLKGAGIIGWMLQNGGSLGTPPLVSTGNSVTCTDGGSGDEWSCIKQGKDTGSHISYYRWGNYCSIPGYTTYGTCEGNGGRWMPNKNYSTCGLDMNTQAPQE